MATAAPPQNFANHRKFVRGFHYVALPILMINLIFSGFVAVTSFDGAASVMALLVALALVMIGLYARLFALGAQDRVIRLEEQLRLRALLPDQTGTIDQLTARQLIGLRFASDGEVGELVAAVATEGIEKADEIKKRVTNWRADHQRL